MNNKYKTTVNEAISSCSSVGGRDCKYISDIINKIYKPCKTYI